MSEWEEGDEMSEQKGSWQRNGISIVVPSAVIAAIASGGMITMLGSNGLMDDPDKLRELARPDPYTGSMHRQYAETVDARFDAGVESHAHLMSRITSFQVNCTKTTDLLRQEIKELRQDREYRQQVLKRMDQLISQLSRGLSK